MLFGRVLPDAMPQLAKEVPIFGSDMIHKQWHKAWEAKEEAIKSRLVRSCEQLEPGSSELPPLREGDQVFVQNQNKSNGRQNKWDRQGTIIASKDNDQHLVKIHGTGRLTLRNRRFLRKFELRPQSVQPPPTYCHLVGAPNMNPHKHTDSEPDKHEGQRQEALQRPEVISREGEEEGPENDVMVAPADATRLGNAREATTRDNDTPEHQAEQPLPTRGPGRPPKKRHFNFAMRHHAQDDTLPNAGNDAQQGSAGSDRPNWREDECRRPMRQRQQRQMYDAASGGYKNPSG